MRDLSRPLLNNRARRVNDRMLLPPRGGATA
jgi:hypothetical protein